MNSVDTQLHGLDYGLINNSSPRPQVSADLDVFDLHKLSVSEQTSCITFELEYNSR